ncbi:MAG: D-alanine--D-alanine ligase [Holosporales bacterium]|nr:D-alanine--D-alanine ligase [Holosporales bacterium]
METNNRKLKLAVITGGWSSEREISLKSAQSMVEAVQRAGRYEVAVIDYGKDLAKFAMELNEAKPDVALLAIHGVGAEDGVLQGVLEVAGIPYTSSSVTASALAMDKVLARIILEKAGLRSPPWELLTLKQLESFPGPYPYVIKPRNEGSSFGVSIIHNKDDLDKALAQWVYGDKVLVERYIRGQEIQIAVVCGKAIGAMEIKPQSEFFDYYAKYTEGATQHIFPPNIPADVYDTMMAASELAVETLECSGVVRVEFIYGDDAGIYLLELNTQPGMTAVSLVPDIAARYGISYEDIVDEMIKSAKVHSR